MAAASLQKGLITAYVPPKTSTVSSAPPPSPRIPSSALYAAGETKTGEVADETKPDKVVLQMPSPRGTPIASPRGAAPRVAAAKKADDESCMAPCIQCFACLGGTGGFALAVYTGVKWLQPALYKALESNPGVDADAGSKGITAVILLFGGLETAVGVGAASFALVAACAWCCTASCRDE